MNYTYLIRSIEDIDRIDSINNLSIEEIERRSKKIDDNTTDAQTWRVRSFEGYLGVNESFKDRLRKDWQLVEQWNQLFSSHPITHTKIASILKDIIAICELNRQHSGLGPMTPIEIDYCTPHELLLLPHQQVIQQKLRITKQLYNGFQYSLFYNDKKNNDNNNNGFFKRLFSLFGNHNNSSNDHYSYDIDWNKKWNYEYIIENLSIRDDQDKRFKDLKIKIAGGVNEGIIQFIEVMGFYEGDETNEYRVDPILLLSFLNAFYFYNVNDNDNRRQDQIQQTLKEYQERQRQYIYSIPTFNKEQQLQYNQLVDNQFNLKYNNNNNNNNNN
ncbi:hypothetical protein PPL_12412 [Heterostelium album PN500]|uniref:Uncharacterized protein n=1 Tax=Heterostelium pallidum (strain ATCC 26659 / Pp 5 / PN500) TaxID=670386 RepID=D3BMJ2_HETP5|nr:hypothetical protein PPL_12412 [Heterostelium album PN500]EFA77204.1 hypothetical protein PPL_12412 [Heterostelium album PN500]|eukprot:XP_020429333.1 hypothetical protein PPL_12412 [Heterostelium album PN500]